MGRRACRAPAEARSDHRRAAGTLLYDAVDLASQRKMNQETGRKAMILLTDGEDQGSRVKLDEAIDAAQKRM